MAPVFLLKSEKKFLLLFIATQFLVGLLVALFYGLISIWFFQNSDTLKNTYSVFSGSIASLVLAVSFYSYLFISFDIKKLFTKLAIAQLMKFFLLIVLVYLGLVVLKLNSFYFFVGFIVLQLSSFLTLINTRKFLS